jgi:CRP-like cAMP-binding protein
VTQPPIELVRDLPALAGLDPSELASLAAFASTDQFDPFTVLAREGQPADAFYIVTQGRVALEIYVPGRGTLLVETLEAGELVGWSWLFPPYRWSFDVRTLVPTRTVTFEASGLRELLENDRDLSSTLLRRFSLTMLQRLQATRLRLVDVYGNAAAS